MNRWKVAMNLFGFIWLTVTLGCIGRLLYGLALLRGYCNGLQEVENKRISFNLQEAKKHIALRKKPKVFVSPRLTSPISMGIRVPSVVLPASLYPSIGDGELRAILLHELAHIYHRDHLLGLLQRVIKALYWWNPFVHRLCNDLSVAREEVSDSYAILGIDSAAGYASLLVRLAEKTSLISHLPCTAGMATPYEALETRIKNIVSKERDMRVKTNRMTIVLVALATVLLCGLVVAGSPVEIFAAGQDSHATDDGIRQRVVGAWKLGSHPDASLTINSDGTFVMKGASGDGKATTGVWRIEKEFIVWGATYPDGTRIDVQRDKVIRVDDRELVLEQEGDTNLTTWHK